MKFKITSILIIWTLCIGMSVADVHPVLIRLNKALTNAKLGPRQLIIEYFRGDIRVTGQIENMKDEQRLQAIAQSIPGVKSVKINVEVKAFDRGQVRAKELLKKIKGLLPNDQYLIRVGFQEDSFEVIARVGSELSREHFLDALKKIDTELPVHTEIIVGTFDQNDFDVESQVEAVILNEFATSALNIQYVVRQGNLLLKGSMSSQREIDRLLAALLMIDGLKDIESQLTIGGLPYQTGLSVLN